MSNVTPPANPPRRKWRVWAIIAGLLHGVLLVLCVMCIAVPRPLGTGRKGDAVSGCAALARACDAFQASKSNPDHDPPKTLVELHRPPWWGDETFLPDGMYSLVDPWGNPYLMQQRERPGGRPDPLILTNAPDGTLISQHGIGPKAVPPADRPLSPSEGEMMAATWLNRGTALGVLLGVCIGAGAVVTWYSTRERPKEEAKANPPPKEAPQPQQPPPPSPADILKANKEKALTGCQTISKAIDAYFLSSSNPGTSDEERLPPSPQALAQPGWTTSFLPDGTQSLIDPWGKQYQFQQSAEEDGTPYLIVYTHAPDGIPISQHGIGPKSRLQ